MFWLCIDDLSLACKTLLEDSAQYIDLLRFSITRTADQTTIIANSTPFRDDAGELVELQWKFDEPLHWAANTMSSETVIQEIIAAKAKELVAMDVSDADLADYGLDDPAYRFEVSDANQTYTITLQVSNGAQGVSAVSNVVGGL